MQASKQGSEWGYGIVDLELEQGVETAAVADEASAAAEDTQELPVVAEEDVQAWLQNETRALRAAGHRGTWEGRRGVRERTFAFREKPPFVGRYTGKCAVTPELLEVEYGALDPGAIFEATA